MGLLSQVHYKKRRGLSEQPLTCHLLYEIFLVGQQKSLSKLRRDFVKVNSQVI